MPNWCSTTYCIEGAKSDIKHLTKIIKGLQKRKKPFIKNGFGNLWLGCIVEKLGRNWESIPDIRGEVIDWESNEVTITLYIESAWGEPTEFRHLLEELSFTVYYREEESGMGVYNTNDIEGRYFPERYYLDAEYEPEYYETLEEVLDSVNDYCQTNATNEEELNQVLDKWNEEHEDNDYIYLHKFNVVV